VNEADWPAGIGPTVEDMALVQFWNPYEYLTVTLVTGSERSLKTSPSTVKV
jgi:hypothetical protein